MTKLTNIMGLPQPIVDAVANDPYNRGNADISVTGLLDPARKRQLELEHADDIVEDVTDRIWSLVGQIGHGILERAETEAITEDRLFMNRYGWTISGQFDRFVIDHGLLQDYKFTSIWAVKDGVKPEWEAQANIYRLLLKENGIKVKKLQIVAILRDWSKAQSKRRNDYPQHQCVVLDVPVWDWKKTEDYIKERLIAHGTAQDDLPECTAEERWCTGDVYKVRKIGNKTAYKLFDTEVQAEEWIVNELGKIDAGEKPDKLPKTIKAEDLEVIFAPGENKRCQDYCGAAPFCQQWRRLNPDKLRLG